MKQQRRLFLQRVASAALLSKLAKGEAQERRRIKSPVAESQLLASCYRSQSNPNYFGVAIANMEGVLQQKLTLPARGHDCLFHPTLPQLLVFARRPGTFMQVIELGDNHFNPNPNPNIKVVESKEGRHFYGHGCFNKKGTLLFTTENDFAAARGVIGIYDVAAGYQRVAEWPSYGVGPHDLCLLSDNHTLLVANGGIETHPDHGREKLNIPSMRSTLVLIDTRTGKLTRTFVLPDEYQALSLRHLSLNSNGDCCFGAQYEGSENDNPPLIGKLTQEGKLNLFACNAVISKSMKGYVSSVCSVPNSPYFVATSSKGGVVSFWDGDTGELEALFTALDASGVVSNGNGVIQSNGAGEFLQYSERELGWMASESVKVNGVLWDNHMEIRL